MKPNSGEAKTVGAINDTHQRFSKPIRLAPTVTPRTATACPDALFPIVVSLH